MENQKQDISSSAYNRSNNNSLLMQFLLHEVCQAAQISKEYQHLISQIQLTTHQKYTKKGRQHLQKAYNCIAQLAGAAYQSARIFSWNFNEGVIARLKQYAALFGNNLYPQDADAIQLERHAERTWIISLECLDLTREQLLLPSKEPASLNSLAEYSEKLCVQISNLSKVLTTILPQFRDDENVLYYLLRNQERLAKIWSPQFLPQLFRKLFPNGKEEVECFLKSRYNKRHFPHIAPDLEKTIDQLMNACPTETP